MYNTSLPMQYVDVPREYKMKRRRNFFLRRQRVIKEFLFNHHSLQMDAFDNRYFRINKLLLLYAGLWPIRSSSNTNIFFYCSIASSCMIILPQIIYLFKHVSNLSDVYDVLSSLAGSSIVMVKVIGLFCKHNKFRNLLQHVQCDWRLLENHENIRILMEYVEKSRIFTKAYLICFATGVSAYITSPFAISIIDTVMGSNVTRPKKLAHPAEFLVDFDKYYYIIFGIMCLAYSSACMTIIAIDTIYFTLLQHSCGMLAILSHRLENCVMYSEPNDVNCNYISNNKWDKNVENMIQCIRLQIRIDRLIQLIEATFEICIIIDFGVGVLFQCTTCVMLVTQMNAMAMMKTVPLLIIQTSRIFFNSWVGQAIIDHGSQIPIAAYNGVWYQTSLQAKKMLLLSLMKSQKSYCITMAKIYVINLESYCTVMKTSLSYVTLMISLNPNDA